MHGEIGAKSSISLLVEQMQMAIQEHIPRLGFLSHFASRCAARVYSSPLERNVCHCVYLVMLQLCGKRLGDPSACWHGPCPVGVICKDKQAALQMLRFCFSCRQQSHKHVCLSPGFAANSKALQPIHTHTHKHTHAKRKEASKKGANKSLILKCVFLVRKTTATG